MSRRLVLLLVTVALAVPGLPGGIAAAQTRICAAGGTQDPAEGGQLDVATYAGAYRCDDNSLQFTFTTHDDWETPAFHEAFVRIDTDEDPSNGCSEGDFLAYAINRGEDVLAGLFASPACDALQAVGLATATITSPNSITMTFDRGILGDPARIAHYGSLSNQGETNATADYAPDDALVDLDMGGLPDPGSVAVCVSDPSDDVTRRTADGEAPVTQPAVDLTEACSYYGTALRFEVRLPAMDFPSLGAGAGPVVLIDLDADGTGDRLVRAIWNGTSFVSEVTDVDGTVVCTGRVSVSGDVMGIGDLAPECVAGVDRFGFSTAMGARAGDDANFVDRAGPAAFTTMRRAAPVDVSETGTHPPSVQVGDPADRSEDGGLSRLSGATRIETSIAASVDAWPEGAAAAVIARQDVEADALAGAALAAAINAPLLLTPSTGLANSVASELRRVLPEGGRVYALGGTAALSDRVLADVQQLGFGVVRLAGLSRVETGLAIAREAAAFLGQVDHILVADAFDFPWALMAGAAAGARSGVVITTSAAGLSADAQALIDAHPDARVTAVGPGATAAVPEAVSINGTDVFQTSVLVAQEFFPEATRVAVASGEVFPDGLAGGAFAGSTGMPLLLSTREELATPVANYLAGGSYSEIILLGGEAALSASVEESLAEFLR